MLSSKNNDFNKTVSKLIQKSFQNRNFFLFCFFFFDRTNTENVKYCSKTQPTILAFIIAVYFAYLSPFDAPVDEKNGKVKSVEAQRLTHCNLSLVIVGAIIMSFLITFGVAGVAGVAQLRISFMIFFCLFAAFTTTFTWGVIIYDKYTHLYNEFILLIDKRVNPPPPNGKVAANYGGFGIVILISVGIAADRTVHKPITSAIMITFRKNQFLFIEDRLKFMLQNLTTL